MSAGRRKAPGACNLLAVTAAGRRLFQFQLGKAGPEPAGDLSVAEGAPLPERLVGRDWRFLLRPRVDVAWLPLETVFVRAVALPTCAPEELAGMVEFQIEKLSPLPPAQVVWTVESVPHADGSGQTAVVTLAARNAVEEHIESLQKGGYVVDRLSNPLLREVLDGPLPKDGLVLVAESQGATPCVLAGWWTGGVLRRMDLFRLPADGSGPALVRLLEGQAWAGAAEGWLGNLPRIQLLAGVSEADLLTPALTGWAGTPPSVQARVALPDLALRTARAAQREHLPTLVADEVRERQQRQFVDTLWVKGLTGLGMAYLAGVFVYLAVLTVQKSRLDTLRDETRGMALQYTNTLQLKARVRVLQEQVALRFAALDCWNSVAERLPETLTLTQLDFKGGRTLSLDGTTTDDNRGDITRFNSELKTVMVDGKPLFSEVKPATTQLRGATLIWRFEAVLGREEVAP